LLHGYQHEKPLTEAERDKLVGEGATFQGIVIHSELSPVDRRMSQVRVAVVFKDGERVEFSEELANLYQPAPGSAEAQRLAEVRGTEQVKHPGRIPKMQMFLSNGETVPVRYDAAHRSRIVLDVPAMQKRALHEYIKREQKPKQQDRAHARAEAGPPWVAPTHCPNCGAPVDQARAFKESDPMCEFCYQPLPVSPLR
jgi:hypothetical protein